MVDRGRAYGVRAREGGRGGRRGPDARTDTWTAGNELVGVRRAQLQSVGVDAGADTDGDPVISTAPVSTPGDRTFVISSWLFARGLGAVLLLAFVSLGVQASGLFGANAVRSPLSDVPSHKGRSARQLEDIVENALLPDKFENARLALSEIQPAARGGLAPELGQGWTHVAVIDDAERARKTHLIEVLNAGASIGAVHRDKADPTHYYVRGELIEFLHQVSKNAFERDGNRVKHAELRKVVTVALQPYVSDHADIVLGHMHPISQREGFSSEITMGDVPSYDVPIVRRALNAGTTMGVIERDGKESDRFFIRNEFYRILAQISADIPKAGMRHDFSRTQIPGPSEIDGGRIEMSPPEAVASSAVPPRRQISDAHKPPASESKSPPDSDVRASAFRQAFSDRLIKSLEIDAAGWAGLQDEAVRRAASETCEVFGRLVRANSKLHNELGKIQEEWQRKLKGQYTVLAPLIQEPNHKLQHESLQKLIEDTEAHVQTILLFSHGPYEKRLRKVADYEQQVGDKLDEDDNELLHRARDIVNALQVNPRNSAEAWQKLTSELAQIESNRAGASPKAPVVDFTARRSG